MGVQGLHAVLYKHLKNYKINGERLAVDATQLLHACLLLSATAHARGIESSIWLREFHKRVQQFVAADCKVVLIFDGASSEAKENVHVKVS